jgi:plastocyanin domain-containing protein
MAKMKHIAQTVDLSITEKGFEPSTVNVRPGTNVILKVTRKTDSTCATQIQIPSKKIKTKLPLNKAVSIEVGRLEKGEIRFGCGMNMMEGGKIFVK